MVIANYVLEGYGEGAVMGVPGHDERDAEVAKNYGFPIRHVVDDSSGNLINSGEYSGQAAASVISALEKRFAVNIQKKVNYNLRDWGVSRQRYWGVPIPMMYDSKSDTKPKPIDECDLPVVLPVENIPALKRGDQILSQDFFRKFSYNGDTKFREIDTLDTFVDSSWYFLRYLDPANSQQIFDSARINHWLPVDKYIGGQEHAILH